MTALKSFVDRLLVFIGRFPSTNGRILATIFAFFATTAVYLTGAMMYSAGRLFKPWTPAWEWLAFLLAMAGVDTAHFLAKRKTDNGTPAPESPPVA